MSVSDPKSVSLSVLGHSSHLLFYQPNKSFALCAPVRGLGFEPFPVSLLDVPGHCCHLVKYRLAGLWYWVAEERFSSLLGQRPKPHRALEEKS